MTVPAPAGHNAAMTNPPDSPSPVAPAGSGALEWHAPTLVRINEKTTVPALLRERVSRSCLLITSTHSSTAY